MFVNDLFKLQENSNEEYYAVYNQPRTTAPDERKAQLRKGIDAVDYNKQQQPPAAPSRERKAGIRQAVTDYNKEKVKEQDDFPNEKTLKQQEQDRWSHYDAAKKAAQGEILGREVDGKVISIPPDHPDYDETFDDLYRQQNPGYPTPNDPGFYLTPFRYPGEPEPAYTKALVEGVAEGLNEFAPSGGGGGRWYSDDQLYDIIGEDWLEAFDVSGDRGNIDFNGERARLFLAQEAEAWLTDRGYRVNVLDVRDDGDELSWYIQGPLYRGLSEGGFDIPEIPRAPQPRPQPKEKTSEDASKYMDTKPGSVTAKQAEELGAMARKAFRPDLNPDYYKDDEPAGKGIVDFHTDDPDEQKIIQNWRQRQVDTRPMRYVNEGLVRDKLYKKHQDLRKKRGAPDPEYYRELKTTFDLPDDERWARTAELKKKYKVTNEDRERYIEELGRAGYEIVTESATLCPECGGAAYADQMLAEKQDACYHKVKSRYKVWPSAYASGALVRCRKKGAANWGNKSKK